MSEFSPETTSTRWLSGADHAEVGVRFKGANTIGRTRWSTKPTITAADRGSRFAFRVPGRSGPDWTYAFVAVDGGTEVTESMTQSVPSPALIRGLRRAAGVTDRAEHLRQGHDQHTRPAGGGGRRPGTRTRPTLNAPTTEQGDRTWNT